MLGSRRRRFARVLSTVSLVATLSCSNDSFSGPDVGFAPGALTITTERLPDGRLGERYSNALLANGGSAGYAWTVESGSLPRGLTLSETGTLSGTPESLQTAAFTARVRSLDGQTASRQLTLRILERAVAPVAISTTVLPPALLNVPFQVVLRASGGAGSDFAWSVTAGSLPPGLALATAGTFSGAPTRTGIFSVTVTVTSAGGTAQRVFTLEVLPGDGTRFDVTPLELGAVSPEIRPHLLAALERWERVISGDLDRADVPQTFFNTSSCGGYARLVNGTSVDDVIVIVEIGPIDGEGGILGRAGPCGLRESGLPFLGALILDSSDLTKLVGSQTLTDLFFHEIGHILGFGVLWGTAGLLEGIEMGDPRFTGRAARREMGELGGDGDVPVEDAGGFGTAYSHWRENSFRSEIMTGYAERPGTPMPLSRVTIASMGDLGYVVNLGEADAYSLPGLQAAPPAPFEPLGRDVILPGPVQVLPGSGKR